MTTDGAASDSACCKYLPRRKGWHSLQSNRAAVKKAKKIEATSESKKGRRAKKNRNVYTDVDLSTLSPYARETLEKYAIEMKEHPSRGRGLFATKSYKPGDVVLEDIPIYSYLSVTEGPLCDYCGCRSLFLKTCSGCQCYRYCCKECQIRAWKEYHSFECGAVRMVILNLKYSEVEVPSTIEFELSADCDGVLGALLDDIRLVSVVQYADKLQRKLEAKGVKLPLENSILGMPELCSLRCHEVHDESSVWAVDASKPLPGEDGKLDEECVAYARATLGDELGPHVVKLFEDLRLERKARSAHVSGMNGECTVDREEDSSANKKDHLPARAAMVKDFLIVGQKRDRELKEMRGKKRGGEIGKDSESPVPAELLPVDDIFSVIALACDNHLPLVHHTDRNRTNSYGKPEGRLLMPVVSFCNHSCLPNCEHPEWNALPMSAATEVEEDIGGLIRRRRVLRAINPIESGDELTICYVGNLDSFEDRREHLWVTQGFDCSCDRCVANMKAMTLYMGEYDEEYLYETFERLRETSDDDPEAIMAEIKAIFEPGYAERQLANFWYLHKPETVDFEKCSRLVSKHVIAEFFKKNGVWAKHKFTESWVSMVNAWGVLAKITRFVDSRLTRLSLRMGRYAAFWGCLEEAFILTLHGLCGEAFLESTHSSSFMCDLSFLANLAFELATESIEARKSRFDSRRSMYLNSYTNTKDCVNSDFGPWYASRIASNAALYKPEFLGRLIRYIGKRVNADCSENPPLSRETMDYSLFKYDTIEPVVGEEKMIDLPSKVVRAMLFPKITCKNLPTELKDIELGNGSKVAMEINIFNCATVLQQSDSNHLTLFYNEVAKCLAEDSLKLLRRNRPEAMNYFENGMVSVDGVPFDIGTVVEMENILRWTKMFDAKYKRNSVAFKVSWAEEVKTHIDCLEQLCAKECLESVYFGEYSDIVDRIVDTVPLSADTLSEWLYNAKIKEQLPDVKTLVSAAGCGFRQAAFKFCPTYYWDGLVRQ
eukprot:Nk52_evm18s288 gene=Nk52_evmTU18s288